MEKIKSFIESEKGKDIMVVIIVILVGLGSFELGRLSKENGSSGIKIQYNGQDNNLTQPESTTQAIIKNTKATAIASLPEQSSSKNFFASSKGSKYYSLGCSAGKTIKQENRVYFTTGEEAEKAGYTLSSACH